jgi:lipoate synthase
VVDARSHAARIVVALTNQCLGCMVHRDHFVGQYLRPTEHHLAVVEYVTPESFEWFKAQGDAMGFKYIAAGPMVRSSYKAGEFFMEHMIRSN